LVVNPPSDPNQYIAGTDLPTMPKPKVTAQLVNYKGGEVDYHYALKIHWKSDPSAWETPHNSSEIYEGDAVGTNTNITDLGINLDNYGMRGGNDITLTVTGKTIADGKVYTNVSNPFIIKGQNPDVATLLAELHNHLYSGYIVDNYAAVVWDESRFNQFSNASKANSNYFIKYPHSTTPDYPLMGGTGVGLMQLDPPPNDDVVWNWVANVQEGQDHFNKDIDRAINYQNTEYFKKYTTPPCSLKNVPKSTDIMQNQVFLQAYCYYNGGSAHYWDWVEPVIKNGKVDQPGHWIKNTQSSPGAVGHTDAVWSYFISNPKPWNE